MISLFIVVRSTVHCKFSGADRHNKTVHLIVAQSSLIDLKLYTEPVAGKLMLACVDVIFGCKDMN